VATLEVDDEIRAQPLGARRSAEVFQPDPGGQARQPARVAGVHRGVAHLKVGGEIITLDHVLGREHATAHDVEQHVGRVVAGNPRVGHTLETVRAPDQLAQGRMIIRQRRAHLLRHRIRRLQGFAECDDLRL
jgi:hypothetical protein